MFAETTNRPEVFTSTARYFCPILIKSGIYQQISIEVPIIKSHANPPTGSRADTSRQTDCQTGRQMDKRTEGQTDSLKQLAKKTVILWRHNVADNNTTYFCPHVKCRVFCPALIEFGFPLQIFIELTNIRFHRNPSSLIRADLW